jgi:hypothetical protein
LGEAWGPGVTDHVFPYTETGAEMKWPVGYPTGAVLQLRLERAFWGQCLVLRGLIAEEFSILNVLRHLFLPLQGFVCN